MTVSRAPEPAFGRGPTSRPEPRLTGSQLVGHVLDLARRGDEDGAVALLGWFDVGDSRAGEAEDDLQRVAADPAVPVRVRAEAWAAWGRSRAHRGGRRETLAAREEALALAPEPDRVVAWAEAAVGVAEPTEITDRLAAARQRWPDSVALLIREAEDSLTRGDLEAARDLLEAVGGTTATEAPWLLAQARLELMAGDPEAAERPARAALSTRPSLARALLAVALHRSGRLADDPGLMGGLISAPPDDIWALARVAEVLLDTGDPSGARRVLDHALTLVPDDVDALRLRGVARAQQEDLAGAAEDLDRAADLGGGDEWLTAIRGEIARLRHDAPAATALLGSLDLDTAPVWVPTSLAQARMAIGDIDGAREAYDDALRVAPSDVQALCGRSEIAIEFEGEEGIVLAESLLDRAVELAPDGPMAHALLGEIHRRRGRLDGAVTAFDRALALKPDYAYALGSKGQALRAEGSPDAVPLLEEAARLAPTTPWILEELVGALDGLGAPDADRVLRRVQRRVRDEGGDVTSLQLRRARLAQQHGRFAEAEELFRTVRELVPDDRGLASEHAATLQSLGRTMEALEIVESLPAAAAEDLDLTWQLIELRWQLGRLDEARVQLEELADGPDPNPTAIAALGEMSRTEGRRAEARRLLEDALRREPEYSYPLASLGALERDEGMVEEAREHLSSALVLQPRYPFAVQELASLELDRGDEDAVRELLDDTDDGPPDRELVTVRADALYGLGDYRSSVRLLDDYLDRSGEDAMVLRARGRAERALGRTRRAATSFLSAAALDDSPGGLVEDVDALTRLERWDDALRLSTAASARGNTAGPMALAVVALGAGAGHAAAAYATARAEEAPHDTVAAMVAPRALRLIGDHPESVRSAQRLVELLPNQPTSGVELAESLWSAGQIGPAREHYAEALARLERRRNNDPDGARTQAWCLLRLGRTDEAADVYGQVLDVTDQPAVVFFDLVLVSLLGSDLREARLLASRAGEETAPMSPPTRRGVLVGALHDLASIDAVLEPGARSFAEALTRRLDDEQAELVGVIDREYGPLPFALEPARAVAEAEPGPLIPVPTVSDRA